MHTQILAVVQNNVLYKNFFSSSILHTAFCSHVSLNSSNLEMVLSFPLSFMTWSFMSAFNPIKKKNHHFHRFGVVWYLHIRFVLICLLLLIWARISQMDIVSSVYHIRRTWSFIPSLVMLTLVTWLKCSPLPTHPSFLYYKCTIFPSAIKNF